nr:hypothetical protein [uncultured Emticicia sp.]
MIDRRKGEQIKKNKSSEHATSKVLPEDTTHATEAVDQYIQYISKKIGTERYIPMVSG